MSGHGPRPPAHPVTCYCGAACVLATSEWGWFYRCTRGGCDGLVGIHRDGSGKPLGVPVDKATRQLRCRVHEVLDPLWKSLAPALGLSSRRARGLLYGWFARTLDQTEFHVGELDAAGCHRVLRLLMETPPAAYFKETP